MEFEYKPPTQTSAICYRKQRYINPLSANPTKWSNALKTICRLLPNDCLSVLDHFAGLVFKGLRKIYVKADREKKQAGPENVKKTPAIGKIWKSTIIILY